MAFPIIGGSQSGGYQISNSLRFNDSDSPYLSRTPSSAGNRRTYTFSFWYKRGNLSSIQHFYTNQNDLFGIESGNYIFFNFNGNVSGGYAFANTLLRDSSAWYHVVCAIDTTNATANDRLKLYINGERLTPSYINNPSQNYESAINNTQIQVIGKRQSNNDRFLDGYLAEFNFIDGQQLSPTDFGEYDDSGIWKPIEYTGTYGTNGFYLDFENSGSLGADQSGNGNNFTPTNLSATDQVLDSPTNNFATLNPLANGGSDLQEGSLECITSTGGFWGSGATQGITSGKWYMEFRDESGAGFFGITDDVFESIRAGSFLGARSTEYCYAPVLARLYNNNSFTSFTTTGFGAGDVIGVAFDMDNKKIYYSVDGTFQNSQDPVNGTNPAQTVSSTPDTYFFAGSDGSGAASRTFQANFGQDSSFAGNLTRQNNSDGNGYGDFYYAPPSGYLALCTQNLATALSPTIDDGSQYFNTVLYTGNGGTNAITGVGFAPDFVWVKERSSTSGHRLGNTTTGSTKSLESSNIAGEVTSADIFSSFDSDGFTHGANNGVNESGQTYVGWNWLANGGTTSSNTDGSITSTVQANTTAGFSIVTYTGTGSAGTVGHGLGSTVAMVITKSRDSASSWQIYHKDLGKDKTMQLEQTAITSTITNYWGTSTPNSTVFGVIGGGYNNNLSGQATIAYCFAEIEGYSKFGSYTGNGSTDGTFVYTGFRPAWLLIKLTDTYTNQNWVLIDNKRSSYNVSKNVLYADKTNAEDTSYNVCDLVSNGFKFRNGSINNHNGSGLSYIYMAFAENPFVTSGATPVTAR